MRVRMSTLCYIEQDGRYLMMHRTKKEKDINKDKWIGVGGHFEEGESPEECLLREVWEETGYHLTSYRFRGIVTFISGKGEIEYMHLFTADGFTGTAVSCNEGELVWMDKKEIWKLNIWEGDKIFFRLLEDELPFFSLKLVYNQQDQMTEAVLNGRKMELFDVLNPDGTRSGVVSERGVVHREGSIHPVSHVWVIRMREDGGYDLLLQKRSREKDSFPGCYDISSAGHVEAGDDYLDTAVRELKEELGITASEEQLRYAGTCRTTYRGEFYGSPFLNCEYSNVYLYLEPVDMEALSLQESEVEEVRWMDAGCCLEGVRNGTFPNCIEEDELLMIHDFMKKTRNVDFFHYTSEKE